MGKGEKGDQMQVPVLRKASSSRQGKSSIFPAAAAVLKAEAALTVSS